MTRLIRPLSVSVLGTILGLAAGLGWFWIKARALVLSAAAARVSAAPSPAAIIKSRGWDFWTIEVDNLSTELRAEKERLRKESEQLDLRAARLAADRQDLEKLRASLDATGRDIGRHVIEIQADEAKNLKILSQTYATLSPKAAVALLRELEETTAVKILWLMKPDVIGPIFEEMAKGPPEDARKAAELSDQLRLMKAESVAASP